MKIISHRGFWNEEILPNSVKSFVNSFENNFGIETDLRDLDGEIVISHDIPLKSDKNIITFADLLKIYKSFSNDSLILALNIKSDGLHNKIKDVLESYKVNNYFLFDMSVPDAIVYYKKGFKNIYTRQSDYEDKPSFYNIAKGIWLDEFDKEWISEEILLNHHKNNKELAIVSPELHKKNNYLERWQFYKNLDIIDSLAICTDYPDKAEEFFNEK